MRRVQVEILVRVIEIALAGVGDVRVQDHVVDTEACLGCGGEEAVLVARRVQSVGLEVVRGGRLLAGKESGGQDGLHDEEGGAKGQDSSSREMHIAEWLMSTARGPDCFGLE